jgi:gamma-glutamylcyclotransferase (GGCT)/AIG2-like uncharacterized protein YtfP
MVLYFGYGMNTNPHGMAQRCPNAISLGYAKLLEHKFRFAGPADVLKHPGSIVHGVLWDITPECLKALDSLEGFPYFYDRELRTVDFYGERVQALVYFMQPGHTESSPGHGYYKCLQEGYHAFGVPTKQIKRAARRAKKFNVYDYKNLTNKSYSSKIATVW